MNPSESQTESIAIIGLAGRFPGAKNPAEFWRNLRDGVESVSFFQDDELQSSLLDGPPPKDNPNFVKARAVLEGADRFDAAFFNVNPKEAEIMDPQHRVFLENAWEALENAGHNPDTFGGLIGLFAGSSMNTYLLSNLVPHRDLIGLVGGFQIMLASDKDYLPTRVSYKLNLRGPSLTVQTACSTSLVAVCLACQNLLNYQCDMALAGGVSITFPQKKGLLYQEGGIISPDGHCRAFDADAGGTVSGDGVGIVVLRRLSDALADGDHICAVIKGCAINNDGSLKIGYTAPSIDGQAEVIAMAQANAGVEPESISCLEAHGTGTPLGDPIEIAGLTKAFRAGTTATGFCAIGSVKSNIGHLDAAAGVAGLIKTVLALQHQQLPPSLHFQRPSPKVDFANSPFYVNDKLREWKPGRTPRRAGVSSFGIGGTNAHVVLEETPAVEPSGQSRPWQLLLLSAKTESALETAAANLAEYLQRNPEINLADVAFTLQAGRKPFGHRRMAVCRSVTDAVQALAGRDAKRVFDGQPGEQQPRVAFMFPGQGAQRAGMGRELYETEAVFREQVNRCCEILQPHLELDLRTILYPEADKLEQAAEQLGQTLLTQPALFVIEYALAQLWMSWGAQPQAMIGHSVGEYVAACLAGVFSLEDALALIAARGRLVQKQPPGAMLAVRLPEQEIKTLLGSKLSLAAVNAPSLCVASGPHDAIETLEKKLKERGAACRRLHTSHAFHSEMVEPALHLFAAKVRKVKLNPPQIPCVSNVTGKWMTAQEATDPNYWAAHLRQTVRFADGLSELAQGQRGILLEVGPGHTLSTLAQQHPAVSPAHRVLSSLSHARETENDQASLLNALGRLWLAGSAVDWRGFYSHERRHRLPLPTYPFDRKRYWIEPAAGQADAHQVQRNGSRGLAEDPPAQETKKQEAGKPRFDPTQFDQRENQTLSELKAVFQELSGVDLSHADTSAKFLELGFDSLFLTQATQAVQKRFGANVTFRQLLEEVTTLEKLAAHLDVQKPEAARRNGSRQTEDPPRAEPRLKPAIVRPAESEAADVKTIPLTDAQREIWFATQLGPAVSTAYNESCTLRLRGPLQLEALQRAVQQLVERHEALRTTFSPSGAFQRIAAAARMEAPLVDFSDLDERNHEACVNDLIGREIQHEFDLVNGPLLRAQIVRLAADHHRLVFTAHHLICDGWSMSVLLYELGELYSANCRGGSCALPEPMPFSSYAQSEVAEQQSPESAAAEAYWVKQFSDSVPVLELPGDRPRPATRTYAGSHQVRSLKPGLAAVVKRFSAERNCTTFTTLLAVFNALVHRLSGQDDIVIGAPAAGQIMGGAKHLVGHCVNLLPLRSRFDARRKFGEYLSALRQTVLDAFERHQYPFGSLVRKLNLPRNPNRVPLANVTFNVGRLRGKLTFERLAVEVARNPKRFVNFDLSFNVTETDDNIALDCYYSTELFDDATITRLLEQYETLLAASINNAERPLWEMPLLSDRERHQLLVEWNDTDAEYPRNACVHELFEAQVRRTPQAVALIGGAERLTYNELDRRAIRLAHRLLESGAGSETLVGICLERSPEMVVGLLAILKAGGAYVPLDPALPKERLAFMLKDSRARILLTQASLRDDLPLEIPHLTVLCLDAMEDVSRPAPRASLPQPAASPDDLAYVIYTSGSTGQPKGVQIAHRAVVNFLHAMLRQPKLSGDDVLLAITTLSFDIAGLELLLPLTVGARVVLAGREEASDGAQLAAKIDSSGATVMQATPATWRLLLDSGWSGCKKLKMLCGGETLPRELANRLLEHGAGLWNLYGPTETTIWSAVHKAEPGDGPVPIGRPVANTQIYILDRNLQPVPIGIPGELLIGGDGLARGYLNRPELTAEKFVPNPFGPKANTRLYRTGDIARYRPDGGLEYLGRLDHQVKLRGYRIELGEIEAVLGRHPAVGQTVVVARQDTPAEKRLVAYVVAKPNTTLKTNELRDVLKTELPDYMMASAFVLLDKLPLTPNGKVDRRALPAPDQNRPDLEEVYAAPRTTTEEALVEIWSEVLGLNKVGIHDNFFELGGHSLLVMQVLTRVREAFRVELSFRHFFEAPAITELAAAIEDLLVREIRELSDEEAERLAGAGDSELLASQRS